MLKFIDEFLSYIVTGDDTLILYIYAKAKQQFIQWCHLILLKLENMKQKSTSKKFVATVFWD